MKRVLLLFSILIFISSCIHFGTPKGVLKPNEMKAVLTDMHLTDAYVSTLSDTLKAKELAKKYYSGIFKKHHTSLKEFEKSLTYYATEPALLDSMYQQIYTELTAKPLSKSPKVEAVQ